MDDGGAGLESFVRSLDLLGDRDRHGGIVAPSRQRARDRDADDAWPAHEACASTKFHSTVLNGFGIPSASACLESSTSLKSAMRLSLTPNTASSWSHGQSGAKMCVVTDS